MPAAGHDETEGTDLGQPVISVIMPVYNCEKYLRQCMDSVVNQTIKDIEIICVDDGSKDDSVAILKEYEAKDKRVQVICQENSGAGVARNMGLTKARGKYLSFLDSDDFFETDMLEKALEKIEADQADFVVFGCDFYLDDQNSFKPASFSLKKDTLPPYTPFNFRAITDNVFRSFVGWAWDKLYRRDFVEKNHLSFQAQRTSNDLLFVFSALVVAERITYLDKVLAHQRRNNTDSLSNTREKSWFCFYNALTALRDTLKERGLFGELEKDFQNYALHFSLWNLNTITGPCYELLYNKLRDEWFSDLGITGHDESYFYNRKEYLQFKEIMEASYEEYKLRLSVVIPIHNAERFIAHSLDIILKEQEVPLEVICVDDCSTDSTPQILADYASRYDNVTVLTNEKNLYAGYSRNRGLLAARGRYVHFLDSDDEVLPHAYKKILELCQEQDLDWVKACAEGFDDQTGETVTNPRYDMSKMPRSLFGEYLDFHRFPKKLLAYTSVVPWNALYKRSFLMENQIRFNGLYCVNDRSFFVHSCIRGRRVMCTNRKLARHRTNVSGSLVMKRAEHFDCQFESYRIMKTLCEENQVSENVRFEILESELYDIFVWYRKVLDAANPKEKLENAEAAAEEAKKEPGLTENDIVPDTEPEIIVKVREDMHAFLLGEVDIPWFEQYGKRSRWLKFRSLAKV